MIGQTRDRGQKIGGRVQGTGDYAADWCVEVRPFIEASMTPLRLSATHKLSHSLPHVPSSSQEKNHHLAPPTLSSSCAVMGSKK